MYDLKRNPYNMSHECVYPRVTVIDDIRDYVIAVVKFNFDGAYWMLLSCIYWYICAREWISSNMTLDGAVAVFIFIMSLSMCFLPEHIAKLIISVGIAILWQLLAHLCHIYS
jgi:hypothetical protein